MPSLGIYCDFTCLYISFDNFTFWTHFFKIERPNKKLSSSFKFLKFMESPLLPILDRKCETGSELGNE